MKKTITFVLLSMLCILGYAQAPPQHTVNFSQVCSSGQMLYYRIINYNDNFVEITYPGTSTSNPWNGYTKPTGNITLPSTVSYNGVTYTVRVIGIDAFKGCSGLTGLIIPNTVTLIDTSAFDGCNGLTGSLTIPNSVTSIGNYAFWNCSGFTGSLTLGNNVTSIGNYAFYGCSSFTGSLTIPNSVTTIGNSAFMGCANFSFIIVRPLTPPTLGSSVFSGVPKTIFMYVPCGSLGNYQAASQWNAFTNMLDTCDPLTYSINEDGVSVTVTGHVDGTAATGSLTIPETKTINDVTYTVTKIGGSAFYGCTGLTGSLTIPNSVTTIGGGAFRGCTGLTGSLYIPESVTLIGNYAFCDCHSFNGTLTLPNSLTEIGVSVFDHCYGFHGFLTIPNSVTMIHDHAFAYCAGFMGSLTIPNSVTFIGSHTFDHCEGMTGMLTIGSSVTEIAGFAFGGCSNFSSISVYTETPPELTPAVFQYVPTNIPVYVPCGSLEDYQSAYGWSDFTNMQCFPEPLTVYDGTVTNEYVPVYGYYTDAFLKAEFVMPASELADMAGGTIISMKFYANRDNVSWDNANFQVFLTEVADATISAFAGPGTVVYQGALSIVGGEMTVDFTTPYQYNGGNLLVGVYNIVTGTYFTSIWYGETVTGASVQGYSYSSLSAISPIQRNFIPKTTFSYTLTECSSPTDLTETDITINSATLSWNGYQDSYDLRYRKKPIFFEDFEKGFPSGWTTIDNDGDGYNWFHSIDGTYFYAHSGTHLMASESWHDGSVLSPDNWLVTPLLQLQGTMKVWLCANSSSYQDEHFAIYLSTSGNSVSDFTTVLVPETVTSSQYVCYFADLSAYAGQQGYIAIRHFNCSDMDRLRLDDFGLFDDPDDTGEWETLYDIGSTYTLTNLEPTTEYEWQVRGRNCDGDGTYTQWSAAHSFTTESCETVIVSEGHPFTEGFENENFLPECWESIPSGSHEWTSDYEEFHSGSGSVFSYYDGPVYLVLPDIELSSDAVAAQLTFWSYNTYLDDFEVGNNNVVLLDGGTETVLWSPETVSRSWVETTVDLSAFLGQTISLAFKYAGDDGNGWYIDDVEVAAIAPIFFVNGNWNDANCWSTGSVPPAGSDVIIQADATVPAGYLAVANTVSIQGGSITVADGGQLKHNTPGLIVTMKKNIVGYGDANNQNNYYLLAFPFNQSEMPVPAAMTANAGCDFYMFNPEYPDAEWRNHREEPISTVGYVTGYLYANPETIELSLTHGTFAVSQESFPYRVVNYTEDSTNAYNGWALLGNPFTYNAYVYAENGDELVPMEVMIYDENGDLQTITCGPIPPMQGFFVHVTETTKVCFRGTGHSYVDLGLPSGTLWATCNVGANTPEEYGDYFAWGETQPKDTYNFITYQYCKGANNTLTKYCNNSSHGYNGYTDDLTTLLPEDDAATANWGDGWRMPSQSEWQELLDNTTMTWTTQNGVDGRLFTASNGNSLFLPAAGCRFNSSLHGAGSNGYYFSSSLYTDNANYEWGFYYYGSGDYYLDFLSRDSGASVRPVRSGVVP